VIGAVAFDFDGTLVRSNQIKRRAFYDAVEDLPAEDLPAAVAALDRLFDEDFSGDRYALFQELCRRLGRDGTPGNRATADILTGRYGEICRRRIADCDEVPGAGEILRELHARTIPLYLVSATPQVDLVVSVRDRGLEPFFSGIFGRPTSKPEHLQAILAVHGIAPQVLVMVGDGYDDYLAAMAVGCHFVAISDAPVAPIKGATRLIPDLRQLDEELRRIAAIAQL